MTSAHRWGGGGGGGLSAPPPGPPGAPPTTPPPPAPPPTPAGGGWFVSTTPRPPYPRKRLVTHCTERWVAPRGPVWTGAENLTTIGIRSTDRPARNESLYPLSYPGQLVFDVQYSNVFTTVQCTEPGTISVKVLNSTETSYTNFNNISRTHYYMFRDLPGKME
jgi:hypothetical protein